MSSVIAIAVAGEGRAHAVRALSLARRLSNRYNVHFFSFGQGYEFLKKTSSFSVHKIDGVRFAVNSRGRVSYIRSLIRVVRYFLRSKERLVALQEKLKAIGATSVITDFEPSLPRAAQLIGLPVHSIDTQHKFAYCTPPKTLPLFLKIYWWIAGFFTRLWIPKADSVTVSAFCYGNLEVKGPHVGLTNIFLRKVFSEVAPAEGEYVLLYTKEKVAKLIFAALKGCPMPVKVYGAKPPDTGPFIHCAIADADFVKDLAGCKAVIAGGGNQLMGEIKAYGKPALIISEPGQWEQAINAHFGLKEGWATPCHLSSLKPETIRMFLENLQAQPRQQDNGLDQLKGFHPLFAKDQG